MKHFTSFVLTAFVFVLGLSTRVHAQNDASPPPGIFTVGSHVGSFLGSDQGRGIAGLDGSGNFVYFTSYGCQYSLSQCFSTINSGYVTSVDTERPALNYDEGTPCTVNGGFKALCNGNFALYVTDSPTFPLEDLYLGSSLDPLHPTLIYQAHFITPGPLNALGDFAFNDDGADNLYIEYTEQNSPVPEPASLALLATGGLSALVSLRIRRA